MSVRVRFPALLAERVAGVSAVDVAATTVDGALREVVQRYPALERLVLAANGAVNPVMVVFLNDRQVARERFGGPVETGDVIELVPAIEGGA